MQGKNLVVLAVIVNLDRPESERLWDWHEEGATLFHAVHNLISVLLKQVIGGKEIVFANLRGEILNVVGRH